MTTRRPSVNPRLQTRTQPEIAEQLNLDVDQRNNIHAEYGDYRTSLEGVFSAGDCRRGQSLVVWAINEGRGCADAVNEFLMAQQNEEKVSMIL